MKKLILIFITMVSVAGVTTWYYFSPRESQEIAVHYHAGFRVYLDNQLQDFSGYQYMNYTPCQEHADKKSAQEEQIEKAHLHDSVGDVVHVHRNGAVWGDLVTNIGIVFPVDKTITAYIDGEEKQDFLSEPIDPYTTLIVSVGESNSSRKAERVERAYIEEIETKSELCGS